MTQKRYLKIFTSAFFIFYFLFFIFPAPARAAAPLPPINPFCFTKDECVLPAYKGTPSPFEVPECKQKAYVDAGYVAAGYVHYCYAPQPNINLQVSIGGYKVQGIGEYIKRLYTYFVGISGIVAALMIIWAGIKWLTAGGAPDRITDAKKKIANAAVGLCLLLGSYVILQTINPDLVNLKMPPIKIPRQELLGMTRCSNRSDFECGKKYQCDALNYINAGNLPCSGVYRGECIGQNCSQAGGGTCSKLDPSRILGVNQAAGGLLAAIVTGRNLDPIYKALMVELLHTAGVTPDVIADRLGIAENEVNLYINADATGTREWACVNTCPNECGSLSPTGTPSDPRNLKNLQTCASPACNCIVSYIGASSDPNKFMPSCRGRLETPPEGQEQDIPCADDSQCVSGRCIRVTIPSHCVPVTGMPAGEICERQSDCTQGLLCNLNANYIASRGVCTTPGSLPEGAYCDKDQLCESGSCTWAIDLGYIAPRGWTYMCD